MKEKYFRSTLVCLNTMLAFLLLAVVLAGCAPGSAAVYDNDKISITATIFPAYDFARATAGDNANISMLVRPGNSIHSYDPSPSDIRKIAESDVFIYIGGESEAWADRVLSTIDMTDKTVLRLIDFVETVAEDYGGGIEDEGHEEHSDEAAINYDEHIWTSPKNAVLLVGAVLDAICAKDPRNADIYRENAVSYIEEIQGIDNELSDIVNNSKRDIIVVADRFPFIYLTDAYGLSYSAAFGGCSDQSDASVRTIANLISAVKENNVPYIYYFEMGAQNVVKSVSEQTGVPALPLHSCQNVSAREFDSGETYVSIMRRNAENLRKGLW